MLETKKSRENLMDVVFGLMFYGGIGIMIGFISKSAFVGFGWMLALYGVSQLLHQFVDWVYDGKENISEK